MKCTLVLLFLLPFSFFASAQVVNIEKQRLDLADTVGWFGHLHAGFNIVSNSSTITSLRTGLRLERIANRHTWMSLADYQLVKADQQNFINDGFLHQRYNYRLKRRLVWEAFVQAQYNEKIRIRFRGLAGTGPRWQLLRKDNRQHIYVGTLYMYEHNTFADTTLTTDDHRLSAYLSFSLRPGSNVVFNSTTYLQPVLFPFGDIRISSVTQIRFSINTRLSFTTDFSLAHDNRQARFFESVPATTYSFINGLRWQF